MAHKTKRPFKPKEGTSVVRLIMEKIALIGGLRACGVIIR